MRTTVVTLICDVSGEPAEETVRFGFDGASYEIDLTGVKAKELRDALAPWVEAGRRVGGKPSRSTATTGSRDEARKVREWARALDIPIADRGRVPASLVARWRAEAGQNGGR